MIGLVGVITRTLVHPVSGRELIPATIGVVRTIVKIAVAHPARLLWVPLWFTTLILATDVDPLLLFPGSQALRHVTRQVGGIITAIADFGFALTTILSGNQHHACSSTGTIDGTGRGIFQHRDTLDIISIEQRQVALYTIYQHEC